MIFAYNLIAVVEMVFRLRPKCSGKGVSLQKSLQKIDSTFFFSKIPCNPSEKFIYYISSLKISGKFHSQETRNH